MPENDISYLRYNYLLLAEAEQIQWFIYDCLCILNEERLTELSSHLTQTTTIEVTFKAYTFNSNLS